MLRKSAKAAPPSPESLAKVSTPHDPWVLFFLREGDDSVTAGYLATLLHLFHRQVVSSASSLALRRITAPGHHQALLGPLQGVLRVRGVGPGLVPGDVVGVDGVVPPDLGAAHLRGVVVAALVLDLHQRECRLVVVGLVQAGRCLQM